MLVITGKIYGKGTVGIVQESICFGPPFVSMRQAMRPQWALVFGMYNGYIQIYSAYITELLL